MHVASWHFAEPNAERDAYLRRLIDACHRNSIQVYAWIELPHVSEEFWNQHPEWREKTALQQDAHLDWRKLMNLANPDCANAAAGVVRGLLDRFDWDGANLAELYFESLEGYSNAARFTPMNADIRSAFHRERGFDPMDLFAPNSRRNPARDAKPMRTFLDWRSNLAVRLQTEWITRLETYRTTTKPHLDLVLTHVDDRLDPTMRDTIGASSAKTLPLAQSRGITFLAEDPATVWDRGPQRYTELAEAYRPVIQRPELLAIDINIVERYQDVYPTRQQTGTELLQLVNLAARAFHRVALYFENSLDGKDLPFLPAAAARLTSATTNSQGLTVIDTPEGIGLTWPKDLPAQVNGQDWPVRDANRLWLPAGKAEVRPGTRTQLPIYLTDLNATLISAKSTETGLEFEYDSKARALAHLDHPPTALWLNETPIPPTATPILPPGHHRVRVVADKPGTSLVTE